MQKKFTLAQQLARVVAAQGKEEQAVPLYKDRIEAEMFWAGLPDKTVAEIQSSLEVLIKDSEGHIDLLEKIRKILTAKLTVTKNG
jgi:hypothetical protein